MKTFAVSRRVLFGVYLEKKSCCDEIKRQHVQQFVLSQILDETHDSDEDIQTVKNEVSSEFCTQLRDRFVKKCYGSRKRFESKFKGWLDTIVRFPRSSLPERANSRGRQEVPYGEAKHTTKLKRAASLAEKGTSASHLLHSATFKFRQEGNEPAAKLSKLIADDPSQSADILYAFKGLSGVTKGTDPLRATPQQSVALLVDANFSKAQYQQVRNFCSGQNANILPSYNDVREEKKDIYPPKTAITISESSAEVELQALLDKDVSRLFKFLECSSSEKLAELTNDCELTLHHKWGFDGSGNHPRYQQNQANSTLHTEESVLLTAISPLRLVAPDKVIWLNPCPSSVRFCKPIRLQFRKESSEVVLQEEAYISKKISALQPTLVTASGKTFRVSHKVYLTMVDGKIRSFLTNTSSFCKCPVCGATPVQMRNSLNFPVDVSAFKYGLSPLHTRIRFLEFILNLAYRLIVRKWRVNDKLIKERKLEIQNAIKERMGILVDVVKHGAGTTNCGNTSRTFFSDPVLAAEVTGVDMKLIEKLAFIADTVNAYKDIDVAKFREDGLAAKDLCDTLYPWYHLPAGVHLVLVHGADIISSLDLPIGAFSEEALESRNKNVKSFRRDRTRKFSAQATMEDLFFRLLLSGDVFLACQNKSN